MCKKWEIKIKKNMTKTKQINVHKGTARKHMKYFKLFRTIKLYVYIYVYLWMEELR